MKKNEQKNAAVKTTVKKANAPHLLFTPERKVINAEAAQHMAARCSDYNDSRSEARNFKCTEFVGLTLKNEDLSGIEAHYSRFVDCCFEGVKFDRMEGHFMELSNCEYKNCSLENANLSFAKISDCIFYNCNLNGVDMPFAQGNFSATCCMMERCTAQNTNLLMVLSACNGYGFEANFSNIELDVLDSNMRRAELNDGIVKGRIEKTDLSGAELNRSDLSELKFNLCATNGMETDNSMGVNEFFEDDFDSDISNALAELEED